MRDLSAKYLRSLNGSFTMTVQAFVVAPGQTGTSPTGTEITVFSGSVDMDSTADIRSWITLETDGKGQFPDNSEDLFSVYGNEIFLRIGMNFGNSSLEWVSLGYFRINSVTQTDHYDFPLYVTGQDRMVKIIDARLTSPQQFSTTDTYGEVVEALATEAYPDIEIEWDDDTDTEPIGRSLIAEEDRYAFLKDLVTSVGKIWYFDYRGILVIKDPPAEDESVWTVSEESILLSLSRELTREGVYNGVVAYGEALDNETPSRYLAVDNNPSSPTYWDGDFGRVPRFYSSPFITTDAQAESAANSLLRQKLGLPYNVEFGTVLNPALEPWDAVTVVFSDKVQVHVIEKIHIPIGEVPEPMTAVTREQTLVILGEG